MRSGVWICALECFHINGRRHSGANARVSSVRGRAGNVSLVLLNLSRIRQLLWHLKAFCSFSVFFVFVSFFPPLFTLKFTTVRKVFFPHREKGEYQPGVPPLRPGSCHLLPSQSSSQDSSVKPGASCCWCPLYPIKTLG